MNLIILELDEIGETGRAHLSGPRASHLVNVLKVSPGQRLRIGVLDGPLGVGVVRSIAGASIELHCDLEKTVSPPHAVDLLLALPRPKVMRRLWSQIAALGVRRIFLTNAERVERHYFDAHAIRAERYRPLLIEGLQQARDTRLPVVSVHKQLKVFIEDQLESLGGRGLRLVADPGGTSPVRKAVRETAEDRVLLAIGPEGGWNDFETALFEKHGFEMVGMGPRTLRTDTACIALLTLVHDSLAARFSQPRITKSRRP